MTGTKFGEDARGLTTVGHSSLNGFGDGMQVLREGDALYVGHVGTTGFGSPVCGQTMADGPVFVLG